MDNKKYFVLSAILAISFYILIVVLFFYYLQTTHIKKVAAISKNTVLQLDIILPNKQVKKQSITTNYKSGSKISKKVVKKSKSISAKQKTNLKSLFANVKTKAAKVTKKKIINIKKSSLASRFKSKFEKQKKVKDLSVSKLVSSKKQSMKKSVISDVKKDSDPYFSKIYTILSSRWEPTRFFNDLKAKILITISNNGDFSYKFLQYSNDTGFDTQLKTFLDNESLKKYPINPNKSITEIEITFQSKSD